MRKRLSIGLLGAMIALSGVAVRADEGMWVYNNVPKQEIKKRYGFDVTDAWLNHLRLSSVRFNSGGSGSFISPNGLVLTNHHIASDTLGKISTPEKNYFTTGFYASTQAEEVKSPDLELNVLESIEDVTAKVVGAMKPEMSIAQANDARRAAIASIEKESLAATGMRSDVVTLYKGAQYHLYRYKKYTDVRLVFAPEFDVAFFGGDPDNFTYPRYNLDMAIFRVYENGAPAKTPNYLKWSKKGVAEGDLVFVSGSPGSTSRLNTVAHLEFLRDHHYPLLIKLFERRAALLHAYGKRGAEQERQAHDDVFGIENRLKVYRGEYQGLSDPAIIERKKQQESALRKAVMADKKFAEEFGDAWDDIAKARQSVVSYYDERRLIDGGLGFDSSLFQIAKQIVRLTEEDTKPNAERLREYSESSRPSLELSLYSPAPIYPEYEKARLADSLAFLAESLGADHPVVKKALDGKSPEARAAELVEGTKLASADARKALVAGGTKAVAESSDPLIKLALAIDPESRAMRKKYEDEVSGVEEEAYAKISRAMYEVNGGSLYPDATFTLRLAFGVVKGYVEDGKQIRYFTDFDGMYDKAKMAGNTDPYHLPDRWIEQRKAFKGSTPLNFVTTSDTIGGNSGSPLVNRKGELVGLNFDRNIHGLVRNFLYDERMARNVAVDSRGMIEALTKLYRATALANEILKAAR